MKFIANALLCCWVGIPAIIVGFLLEYLRRGFAIGREAADNMMDGES